jgi:hypothetical protein
MGERTVMWNEDMVKVTGNKTKYAGFILKEFIAKPLLEL